ncbi:FG-GAP-like repeat-containing protein [Nonomuraea rosea]|uniref:FG-GAP-like repeat-containing protein n=1 Tax=Nonomuraea rosea TaxID=638574 RepID=UPI0031EC63A0
MLKRRLAGAAMLLSVVAGGLVATSTAAAAAPDFQLPFPCDQKWRLNTWDSTHAPALDMVREPQSGTEGSQVVAPAAGRVNKSSYHSNAGNMIQIDHGGGHFTTYLHLQSRSVGVGDRVTRGQNIGRVGHTGPTSNGSPHLHYEQGYDANGDGSASWGFEGAERVTARFGGKAYGPAPGGEWRNVESLNGCKKPSLFGADFNSDGIGDIFSEATGTLNVWNGKGANNFTSRIEIGANWEQYSKPIAGDFNSDGISDLMAVKDGTLHVWNGKGGNDFAGAIALGPGWTPYAGTLMSLGDINGDGYTDIGAIANDHLHVWNGKGANNFSSRIELGANWGQYSRPIGGDFNSDGIGDIAAVKDGILHVWNGEGGNDFAGAIALGPGWTPYIPTLMTLGDINGDGNTDIAAVLNDHLQVWNGKGANNFSSRIELGPGWTPYFPGS